ncbi:hypothetical protein S7711_09860 [Stachybotrys chartarum IBT 7711]|uniref:Uncharacterized protein n=1 Tax=Stachybotrys chartarum (strain CBS 109288 / IBT 7711) TaxID=1280523 RepID=A0A084AID8_STACB|nr:hypothetical protein S7711_09860 [Stachybotrys chartarum IBT 7711]
MRQDLAEELGGQFLSAADALYACIRDGHLARLQALLHDSSTAPDLGRIHPEYGTPLHFAAWCSDLDAVELLLAAGADPLTITAKPFTSRPVHIAAQKGHRGVFHRLWSCVAPEDQIRGMSFHMVPLRVAAARGHTRIVEDMLKWNGWSEDHKVAALDAAAARWHFEAAAVLMGSIAFHSGVLLQVLSGALDHLAWGGPNPPTPEGFDYHKHQQLIELLVNTLKADPRPDPFGGAYFVREAAYNANFTGALKTLLEHGADPDEQDGGGCSALHILASPVPVGRWSNGRQVINEPAIALLLQHGASVTTADKKGDSPLQLAASYSDLRTFCLLLSQSSKHDEDEQTLLTLTNAEQETLLHYAAAGCQVEIMEYLISRGLDVNAKNSNGWTPLVCALIPTPNSPPRHGIAETINTPAESMQAALLLLSHGADPSVATDEGWTTLHALALHCDLDVRGKVAELTAKLIEQGVDPAARAPLLTYYPNDAAIIRYTFGIGPNSVSNHNASQPPRLDIPWGHRVREAMMRTSVSYFVIMQPNLTPLQWSAQRGAVGVVRALLATGVDTSVRDANDLSVVDMVCDSKVLAARTEAANAILNLLAAPGRVVRGSAHITGEES